MIPITVMLDAVLRIQMAHGPNVGIEPIALMGDEAQLTVILDNQQIGYIDENGFTER